MDGARIQRIFATNVIGSFLCLGRCVACQPNAAALGCHCQCLVSASRLGAPGEYVDYAARKGRGHVDDALGEGSADEGIRVNAVRAAYIYTDMHASGGSRGVSIA